MKLVIDQGKLVRVTTDCASNLTGQNSGMTKLMRNRHPESLVIHYLCHRLELALKDAVKRSSVKSLNDKIITRMIGLHYFYKRSDKQKKGLK